jgi:hypothetical protein
VPYVLSGAFPRAVILGFKASFGCVPTSFAWRSFALARAGFPLSLVTRLIARDEAGPRQCGRVGLQSVPLPLGARRTQSRRPKQARSTYTRHT